MLMIFLTLPFHAFLGVTIMGQTELIGGDWYPNLHRTMEWLPDPAKDQNLAGGILWGSGDLIGLMFFAVLFVQWARASMAEARREDRRLDLLERQAPAAEPAETAPLVEPVETTRPAQDGH
jgi:putative copper resistance protein D